MNPRGTDRGSSVGEGIRVLVVEDDADALEVLSEVLRYAGHEVHVATR